MKTMMKAVIAAAVSVCGIFSALAETNITGAVTLDADADWTGLGPVRLSPGASLDLNGHSLKCAGFAEYVELDHVDTDGTQWVNTRYTPAGTDKVEMKFQMKDVSTQQFLLCSRKGTGAGDGGFGLWTPGSGNLRFFRRNANGLSAYDYSITQDTDYVTVQDYNEKWVEVNGVTNDFSGSANGQLDLVTSGPFALFCAHTAGTSLSNTTQVASMAKCRFYYMKVWDKDGNLKCDIVPAIGINEKKVGLYDRVRNVFLAPVENGGADTRFDGDTNNRVELPYVDTDGAQYVDTNFTPNHTNVLQITVQMLKKDETQGLFSTRNSSGKQSITLFAMSSNNFRFDHSGQHTYETIFDTETKYTLLAEPHVDSGKVHNYINGTKMAEESLTSALKPAQSIVLFCSRKANNFEAPATCRFYSFKVWDNCNDMNLLHDFVPVWAYGSKRIRLYDRVGKQYYDPKDPSNGSSNAFAVPCAAEVSNGGAGRSTLEVAVADGAAVANSLVSFASTIDFVKSGDGEWVCAKGLDVGGSFALNGGTVGGVTMQNESVLDFSARTTPLDLDTCGLAFASGAMIYVAVGNRSITASAPLASWTTAPSGVTFRRDAATPRRFSVWTTETGLYAAYRGLIISFH